MNTNTTNVLVMSVVRSWGFARPTGEIFNPPAVCKIDPNLRIKCFHIENMEDTIRQGLARMGYSQTSIKTFVDHASVFLRKNMGKPKPLTEESWKTPFDETMKKAMEDITQISTKRNKVKAMRLTHQVLDMEDSSELGNYYKTVAKETKEARETTKRPPIDDAVYQKQKESLEKDM